MMENNSNNSQGGFVVNVNSPGNQIIQTQNNNYYGPVFQGTGKGMEQTGFSDEQIKKALTACVGEGKEINLKKKWAGAYWCLRHLCYYPADTKEFCKKIDSLKLDLPEGLECDYDNIRRFCQLSFMDYNPFGKEEVKVSKMDKDVYAWVKPVTMKLAEELGKTYLPKG